MDKAVVWRNGHGMGRVSDMVAKEWSYAWPLSESVPFLSSAGLESKKAHCVTFRCRRKIHAGLSFTVFDAMVK